MPSCSRLLRGKTVVFDVIDLLIYYVKSLFNLDIWYLEKESCLYLNLLVT
jgi:hypothetical protein